MSRMPRRSITIPCILAAATLCACQSGWTQATKSPPTESGDPYFKIDQPSALNQPAPLPKNQSTTYSFEVPLQPKRYAASEPNPAATEPNPVAAESNPMDQRLKPMPLAPSINTALEPRRSTQNGLGLGADNLVPTPKSTGRPLFAESNIVTGPSTGGAKSSELDAILNLRVNNPESKLEAPASPGPSESLSTKTDPVPQSEEVFEPGRVLVLVGGRPILVGDMLQEINELIEKNAQQAPETQKRTQRQMLVPRMLPKFVDRQLIYVDSVRGLPDGAKIEQINESLGKSFDEEALPKFLEKSGAPSSAHMDAQLRALGSSLRQFRQSWIEDQFVKYSISQKMQSDDEVSYQEMKVYYEQHASDFQFLARARWEQLVVRFDREPDRETARRLIAEMGNQVVYGAPLDAVAKESSHDSKAKEGGQQGWVTQGSLALTALDEAIFQLPLNELSDVIETPSGLHIIRVLERTPAGAKPFRDAQVDIKEKLLQAKHEKRFQDYLDKLRREIPIEVIDHSVKLPDHYIVR